MNYTRAKREEQITYSDGTSRRAKGDVVSHRIDTNEILLTDSSGIVCAGVSTNLSAYSGAQGAVNKMEREGTTRETFTYQRFSPAQFAGLQCGGYYRWGSGTAAIYDQSGNERPRDIVEDTSLIELGFHVEGSEELYKDLYWTARFRFGGGDVGQSDEDTLVDGTRIILPLDFGVLYAPAFLFGVGAKAFGGFDVLNFVVEAGSNLEKFNYGASAFYRAGVGPVGFGIEGGWRHESGATTDPATWVEADDRFATIWALYNFL